MTLNTLKYPLQSHENSEFFFPSVGEKVGEIIQQNSKHIVLGDGAVGGKAQELLDKTGVIESFNTPDFRVEVAKSVMISLDVLSKIFGLDFTQLDEFEARNQIENAFINDTYLDEIWSILQIQLDSNIPLIVRSSGNHDAVGTGIYTSEFCTNNKNFFMKALKSVLKSYYSPNAIAWKKHSHNQAPDFGIMVQNISGTLHYENNQMISIAPDISFYGYSSTFHDPKGYLQMVTGIGCGVNTPSFKITPESIVYIQKDIFDMRKRLRYKFLDKNSEGEYFDLQRNGLGTRIFSTHNLKNLEKNLGVFFDVLQKIEQKIGVPQYFECIYHENSGQFTFVQIADIHSSSEKIETKLQGTRIAEGLSKTGNINKISQSIFFLTDENFDQLEKYNGENKDYILIFNGNQISSGLFDKLRGKYSIFSNAASIVEGVKKVEFGENPFQLNQVYGHFEGLLRSCGISFSFVNIDALSFLDQKGVLTGKFHIISNEREQKFFIGKID